MDAEIKASPPCRCVSDQFIAAGKARASRSFHPATLEWDHANREGPSACVPGLPFNIRANARRPFYQAIDHETEQREGTHSSVTSTCRITAQRLVHSAKARHRTLENSGKRSEINYSCENPLVSYQLEPGGLPGTVTSRFRDQIFLAALQIASLRVHVRRRPPAKDTKKYIQILGIFGLKNQFQNKMRNIRLDEHTI